jgi:undecaprenyl-phosphate 4-deoxy-4-formamido-L-arabinose transferase
MDDDLQHRPEDIPALLRELEKGYDVVYGSPAKLPHSGLRNVLSRTTKVILGRAMGVKSIVNLGAFRAFRTSVRRGFKDFRSPNPMIDILLSWGTAKFTSINVDHEPRRVGVSNYTFMKLFNQAMLMITGFTTAPLRLASLVGFAFTVFGIGVFVWVVVRYVLYGSVPGFPFLASLISIFSGAQLFTIGIMGEYLARMFNRSMDRPVYAVRETTSAGVAERATEARAREAAA